MSKELSHLDASGRAAMIDVGAKPTTERMARATGRVRMQAATLEAALAGDAKKGDVRAIAELAGVMAAKRTADLIPLCHPLLLSFVNVRLVPDPALPGFSVQAEARTGGQTGVEMEALTAVTVACLTIYDMLKALDRGMTIENVCLIEKRGGASGDFVQGETC